MAPARFSRKTHATTSQSDPPGFVDLRTCRHLTKGSLTRIPVRTLLVMSARLRLPTSGGGKADCVEALYEHWLKLDPARSIASGLAAAERILLKQEIIGRNAFHKFKKSVLRELCHQYGLLLDDKTASKEACMKALWQWHEENRFSSSDSQDCLDILRSFSDGSRLPVEEEGHLLEDAPSPNVAETEAPGDGLLPSPPQSPLGKEASASGAPSCSASAKPPVRRDSPDHNEAGVSETGNSYVLIKIFPYPKSRQPTWELPFCVNVDGGVDIEEVAAEVDRRKRDVAKTWLRVIDPRTFEPIRTHVLDANAVNSLSEPGYLRMTFEEYVSYPLSPAILAMLQSPSQQPLH